MSDQPQLANHAWQDGRPFGQPGRVCKACGAREGERMGRGPCMGRQIPMGRVIDDYDPHEGMGATA